MNLLLKNNSENIFLDIALFDELPAGLLYLDDDASPKATRSGKKISWFIPELEAGGQINIHVKLKIADSCPRERFAIRLISSIPCCRNSCLPIKRS